LTFGQKDTPLRCQKKRPDRLPFFQQVGKGKKKKRGKKKGGAIIDPIAAEDAIERRVLKERVRFLPAKKKRKGGLE